MGLLIARMRVGNYLRVRGEYRLSDPENTVLVELPPRARRIHLYYRGVRQCPGTTSACAENTYHPNGQPRYPGNYLRVRGEYPAKCAYPMVMVELPPRARRILDEALKQNETDGTTSACAENTGPLPVLMRP